MSLATQQILTTEPPSSAPINMAKANGIVTEEVEFLGQQILVAQTVLQQAIDVIDNQLTSDDQLTVHSKYLPGSTIGKHLRHANDHFRSIIQTIDQSTGSELHILDYDRSRTRNSPMESSRASAKEKLAETMQKLENIPSTTDWNAPVQLHAITPYDQKMMSSLGRELWFASLHCVHHWSMVRVIAGELGITLSEDFGFAPSTLVHQGRDGALSKAKI
ncbi:fk506-binding protein 5 [Moniliophthora roreri MCA 2997]|uniref:Fk506-binding protein 5 n=1 Tax=Moniliophthora roreri (strain MCA 2997) TaxID=1381753 RepID=V2Y048_MONRO|nr:fk506-binding protein 5 [Moniliophthora roreri MCA 2997]